MTNDGRNTTISETVSTFG